MEQNQTTKHCGRIARAMRTSGIILLSVLLTLYVLLPFGMGVFAAIRPARKIETPPEGFQALTLIAQDGMELACWYAPDTNGAAIILVHGSKSNLASVETHAAMLREAGFVLEDEETMYLPNTPKIAGYVSWGAARIA